MAKEPLKPYLATTESEKASYDPSANIKLNQAFKGIVIDKEIKFPRGLGAAHPFDFEEIENVYKRVGLINGAVNKITDSIMGDFTITIENEKSQEILDNFIHDSNFTTVLRSWINEGVLKGNGFMELDLENSKARVMNASHMYVMRNKKGKVLKYNQYTGNAKNFTVQKDKRKVVEFAENKIAHLPLNKVPNDPYGIGYTWPTLVAVNHYTSSELDLHKLMTRKAGAPIHVQCGVKGEATDPSAIDDFKTKLQYMTNSTEWVSDANVEMKTIDFAGVGDNLMSLADHDIEQIAFGMQIPLVMMGKANVPEGLAKVQENTFKKFIDSVRTIIEDVIEEKVLRPLLVEQMPQLGLEINKQLIEAPNLRVEFTWELPSGKDKTERLKMLNDAIKNPMLSAEMRAALEIEYAKVAGLDTVLEILKKPKEAQEKAEQEEEDEKKELERVHKQEEEQMKQPVVVAPKPIKQADKVALTEHVCTEECDCQLTEEAARDMKLSQYVNLTEVAGFQYTDYLIKILQTLKTYDFFELAAHNMEEVALGLLDHKDIEKLRIVLKNGFKKNKTIRQIEHEISKSIDLKDRLVIDDGVEKLALHSKARALFIARTETVRLANQGLKKLYKEHNIEKYRYLAALDDRTSEICISLNGNVYNVADGQPGTNMPPMHVNCRSTIVGLVE